MTDRLAELGALQYAVENLSTAGTNPNRLGLAGYIHAAYTDYQTWAAANPGVNPNRLSARGRLYGYFYDNASWSPSSLFANSEVGAWYDPSDLSTMFQDSAGTTPVTEDGQPVGKILDKSGRGNHASQATAASRPLYKTDGTYHWLQFDGVDDGLSTVAIDFTSTDKMSVFSGFVNTVIANNTHIVYCGTGDYGSAKCFGVQAPLSQTGRISVLQGDATTYQNPFGITTTLTASKFVTAVGIDNAAATLPDQVSLRANTVQNTMTNGSALTPGSAFDSYPIYLGQGADGWFFRLNGNIYSLIVRGALSTTQEITDTETWVNGKTGAWA